jgi:subtilase family serine protease
VNFWGLCSFGTVVAAVSVSTAFGQATTYNITGNTPGFVRQAVDKGAVDPSTTLTVSVWLKLHNQQQLDRLVSQQNQRGASNYHRWITQNQFDATYGPTVREVNAVSQFLTAQNLTVLYVPENNLYVKAKGTVADIQSAFHTQLHTFNFKGETYRSNTGDPSIGNPAGGLIAAVTGLDDVGFQPHIARPVNSEGMTVARVPASISSKGLFFEGDCFDRTQTVMFNSATATASYTGNRFGADITSDKLGHLPPCGYSPVELQTAYNLTPLYNSGFDGTGETIVITDAYGSSTIAQDAQLFSQVYGLPPINLQVARAPGLPNNPHAGTWADETTLDVEWAHAVAPRAAIVLVVATDRSSLDEAINYAVVHHFGNTISNSWGLLEGFGNPAQFNSMNRILEMAGAQGIDVNFSSGDDGDESLVAGFKTVDFPASSPYATGIGGTSLALGPRASIMFQTGWGTNLTRIADTNATNNAPYNPPQQLGFQFGAGGGASLSFPRPPFQDGLNVPGSTRLVPDISWLADPYTGVEIIQTVGGQTGVAVIGGTSLAAPMFSGLMAIAGQSAGHGLGQAAALVYNLSSAAVTDG